MEGKKVKLPGGRTVTLRRPGMLAQAKAAAEATKSATGNETADQAVAAALFCCAYLADPVAHCDEDGDPGSYFDNLFTLAEQLALLAAVGEDQKEMREALAPLGISGSSA